jgi:hypothetical protein
MHKYISVLENLKIALGTGEESSNKWISLNFTSLSPHIQIFLPNFQDLAFAFVFETSRVHPAGHGLIN